MDVVKLTWLVELKVGLGLRSATTTTREATTVCLFRGREQHQRYIQHNNNKFFLRRSCPCPLILTCWLAYSIECGSSVVMYFFYSIFRFILFNSLTFSLSVFFPKYKVVGTLKTYSSRPWCTTSTYIFTLLSRCAFMTVLEIIQLIVRAQHRGWLPSLLFSIFMIIITATICIWQCMWMLQAGAPRRRGWNNGTRRLCLYTYKILTRHMYQQYNHCARRDLYVMGFMLFCYECMYILYAI